MLDLSELRVLLSTVKDEEPNNEPEPVFDPAKVSPVFFGRYGVKVQDLSRVDNLEECLGEKLKESTPSANKLDPSVEHPSISGYALLDKRPKFKKKAIDLPNPKTCSPREYIEFYIFPVLLPALEAMFPAAKQARVFERRITRFNACDFLTEFLYRHNPRYTGRDEVTLEEIPFVQRMLAENPRPPLPLSLLLSDEQAATIIQSHYRGYMVRKDPEVQELREYQREMREEAVDINLKVEDFWRKHSLETAGDKEDTPKT